MFLCYLWGVLLRLFCSVLISFLDEHTFQEWDCSLMLKLSDISIVSFTQTQLSCLPGVNNYWERKTVQSFLADHQPRNQKNPIHSRSFQWRPGAWSHPSSKRQLLTKKWYLVIWPTVLLQSWHLRRNIGRKVYTFLQFVKCFGKIVLVVYVVSAVLVNSSRWFFVNKHDLLSSTL
jgi:hypothetical protein